MRKTIAITYINHTKPRYGVAYREDDGTIGDHLFSAPNECAAKEYAEFFAEGFRAAGGEITIFEATIWLD